jgi:hypothetical protein
MTRLRLFACCAGGAGILMAGFLLLGADAAEPAPTTLVTGAPPKAPTPRMSSPASPSEPNRQAAAPTRRPAAEEPPLDPETQRFRAGVARLERRIETESLDSEWTLQVTERVEGVLAEAAPGVDLVGVSCHASICRADFVAVDSASQAQLGRALGELVELDSEALARVDGPDDLEVEVYLARPDHDLPQVFDPL